MGFYFDFIESHARFLGDRLRRRGKGLEFQSGDTLKDVIHKWLVRETLLQNDRAIARRAALEYRELRRAQELQRKNSRNSKLPRSSKDRKIIADILRSDESLTWKQVLQESEKLGTPLKAPGLKDRVSRMRKSLMAEAAGDEWLCDDSSD